MVVARKLVKNGEKTSFRFYLLIREMMLVTSCLSTLYWKKRRWDKRLHYFNTNPYRRCILFTCLFSLSGWQSNYFPPFFPAQHGKWRKKEDKEESLYGGALGFGAFIYRVVDGGIIIVRFEIQRYRELERDGVGDWESGGVWEWFTSFAIIESCVFCM